MFARICGDLNSSIRNLILRNLRITTVIWSMGTYLNNCLLCRQKYKIVVHLHYIEGYKVDEIARILSLSLSAVKMRLLRGRELLKNRIKRRSMAVNTIKIIGPLLSSNLLKNRMHIWYRFNKNTCSIKGGCLEYDNQL